MPFKGSKCKIAEKIINILPDAEVFVDLFGGGGAISLLNLKSKVSESFVNLIKQELKRNVQL